MKPLILMCMPGQLLLRLGMMWWRRMIRMFTRNSKVYEVRIIDNSVVKDYLLTVGTRLQGGFVRAYNKERLDNAIAYIVKMHKGLTGKEAAQTYIYKYLALIDFKALEETGKPVFDLDYDAFENGPVPVDLYDKRESVSGDEGFSDVIALERVDKDNYIFTIKKEPNLDYLSDYELELIESIVEEFALKKGKYLTTEHLIDATHERIIAWKIAWKNRGNLGRVHMNSLDTFENFKDKREQDLTAVEEVALIHDALHNSY